MEQYVIPQLGKTYVRADYPVGSKVLVRLLRSTTAQAHSLRTLSTEGTIINYVSYDDTDNAYDQVEVEWHLDFRDVKLVVMLQNIILVEDLGIYKANEHQQRAIKFAMLDIGGLLQPSVNTWEEWFELEIDLDRKVALIKAGVPIDNINVYDELSLEELSSLKQFLRVLEKE